MAFSLGGGYCSAVLYLISNLALLLPPHRVRRKEELSRLSRMNQKLSRAVSVLVNPINISAIAKNAIFLSRAVSVLVNPINISVIAKTQ
jgi:hypothetical protein